MPDENDIFILKQRAEAMLAIGRYREAIPLLHKALAIDAQQSDILCMLAFTHVNLEEYREAMTWAEKAVAVNPEEEWGHRLRSIIFMRTNRLKQSLIAALEAAKWMPDGIFTLSTLAEAQVCNNQMAQAEQTVMRLLTVAPEEGLAHRTRAYVFIYQKKYVEAEASSRVALRLEPENSRAMRLLGDALRGQKRLREAIDSYADSLRRSPTNAETRKALQETAMDYLGWPWGPQIVGLSIAVVLTLLNLELRLALGLGALAVWGYGWITARHGLHEVWSGNPKFTDLPAATQAMVVDVCRAETPHYLQAAVQRYSFCCLALLVLFLLIMLWRGEPGSPDAFTMNRILALLQHR